MHRTNVNYIVTGLLLGGLIVLAFEFWLSEPDPISADSASGGQAILDSNPDPDTTVDPTEQLPVGSPAASPEIELPQPIPRQPSVQLPALDESDGWIKEGLENLGVDTSPWPEQDMVARGAALLAAGADGHLIRKDWPRLPGFSVVKQGESIWLDPAGYERFDPFIKMLEAIEPERLAEFVVTVEPLLNEALTGLGDRRRVSDLLAAAHRSVRSAPVATERLALIQPGVLYQFKDPRWEGMSDLHKQFLRMGPDRTRRIRGYADLFMQAYQRTSP